jgi:hypothetical protein
MDHPVGTSRTRILESGLSVVRAKSLKSTGIIPKLLMLSNPLVVRYVSIVLRVALNENSVTLLCPTLKMGIRVRVVRLPRSPRLQLLSHSATSDSRRSPSSLSASRARRSFTHIQRSEALRILWKQAKAKMHSHPLGDGHRGYCTVQRSIGISPECLDCKADSTVDT